MTLRTFCRRKNLQLSERTKFGTSDIKKKQVNRGEHMYSENSMSKLKYRIHCNCAERFGLIWRCNTPQLADTNKSKILQFRKIFLQKTMAEAKKCCYRDSVTLISMLLKKLNGMFGGRSDSESVQKVFLILMRSGDEKWLIYVYPVDWIKPKGEKQKGKNMIKAEIVMVIVFTHIKEIRFN